MNFNTKSHQLYRLIEVQRTNNGRICKTPSFWFPTLELARTVGRSMPLGFTTVRLRLENSSGKIISSVLPEDQAKI